MAILDSYGNPARSPRTFINAADTSRLRGPQYSLVNRSLEELITERDRDVIVSLAKRLHFNLGPARAVVTQKANYSVGRAWSPRYGGGQDKDKGKSEAVLNWFSNSFFQFCDVRGGQWDWWSDLIEVSTEMDVTGDHFTLLTQSEDGNYPLIQSIPSWSIKTKDANQGVVKNGKWRGYKIHCGVILGKRNRPVAYRMTTGEKESDFEDLPAYAVIHSFTPTLSDGHRGLPVATHALDDLKHILQSTEYESTRQLIISSIGLMVENDIGGPDVNDPSSIMGGYGSSTEEGVSAKEISPAIWYAQAGQGEKISQLRHETGGDSFESFQDRMIRSFVTGADWSYSLVWKPTGQGTAERAEVMQARHAVANRQARLEKWARRVLTYAYGFMVKRKKLPLLEAPMSWTFTKPARISVDDGREAQMLREGFKMGNYNMTDLLEAEGKSYHDHVNERINEIVYRKKAIALAKQATGLSIDERDLVMLTPNEQPESNQSNNQTTNENS